MEKIKSNVPKETGDAIRSYELAGVKVDEDSKRIYPYSELASKSSVLPEPIIREYWDWR